MSKRLACADLHLSGFLDDPASESGLTKRLDKIISIIKCGVQYCRKNNIKFLDILGDIINDKDVIYNTAYNSFGDILSENSDIVFTLVSGNHDMSSTGENQKSAVSIFKGCSNVQCITQSVVLGNISIVPFSFSMYEDLKKIQPNDILLSHFGLNEAMLQSGISVRTNVKLSDLRNFKLVLLGHYHKPQFLENESTRLYYVGNVAHLNWNDKNEHKRFLEYDTETLEVKEVPIDGFSEFREYIINSKEEKDSVIKQAEKDKEEGHIVRIRKNIDCEIVNEQNLTIIEQPKEIDVTNRGIEFSSRLEEKLKKYLEIKQVPKNLHDQYFKVLIENKIVTLH